MNLECWLISTPLVFSMVAAATAQEPAASQPERQFEEEIEVTEVLLDVLVTDDEGEPVTGLGREDFVVEEDGEEVDLTGVTFYATGALPGPAAGERRDRYFILFFHNPKGVDREGQAARVRLMREVPEWVKEELLPDDQVAVLGYRYDLELYQDFTRDKEAVGAAVEAAANRAPGRDESEPPVLRGLGESPSLFVNLPAGRELERQARTFQEAMDLVARAAAGIAGRKNLVLFSNGFGPAPRLGELQPEEREYKEMKRSLNDGLVAVYSVDVGRIARGAEPAPILHAPLRKIALDTGGRYFDDSTRFRAPLDDVADETRGYYLISYRSEHEAGASGYERVKVKTTDEALRVRTREGYRYGG